MGEGYMCRLSPESNRRYADMRSNTRRSQLDQKRYMTHREERKAKQREYYQANRGHYLQLARQRYLI